MEIIQFTTIILRTHRTNNAKFNYMLKMQQTHSRNMDRSNTSNASNEWEWLPISKGKHTKTIDHFKDDSSNQLRCTSFLCVCVCCSEVHTSQTEKCCLNNSKTVCLIEILVQNRSKTNYSNRIRVKLKAICNKLCSEQILKLIQGFGCVRKEKYDIVLR